MFGRVFKLSVIESDSMPLSYFSVAKFSNAYFDNASSKSFTLFCNDAMVWSPTAPVTDLVGEWLVNPVSQGRTSG